MLCSLLLALVSAASAAPGQSGLLLQGAEPIPQGQVALGGGVVMMPVAGATAAGVMGEAVVGLTDRVAVHGVAVVLEQPGLSQVVHVLDVRGLIVDRSWLHLGVAATHLGASSDLVVPQLSTLMQPQNATVGMGWVVEGGFRHLRFDTSSPILAVHYADPERRDLLDLPYEAGISLLLGDHHRLRFGGPVPHLSYRYQDDHTYFESFCGQMPQAWGVGLRAGVIF